MILERVDYFRSALWSALADPDPDYPYTPYSERRKWVLGALRLPEVWQDTIWPGVKDSFKAGSFAPLNTALNTLDEDDGGFHASLLLWLGPVVAVLLTVGWHVDNFFARFLAPLLALLFAIGLIAPYAAAAWRWIEPRYRAFLAWQERNAAAQEKRLFEARARAEKRAAWWRQKRSAWFEKLKRLNPKRAFNRYRTAFLEWERNRAVRREAAWRRRIDRWEAWWLERYKARLEARLDREDAAEQRKLARKNRPPFSARLKAWWLHLPPDHSSLVPSKPKPVEQADKNIPLVGSATQDDDLDGLSRKLPRSVPAKPSLVRRSAVWVLQGTMAAVIVLWMAVASLYVEADWPRRVLQPVHDLLYWMLFG